MTCCCCIGDTVNITDTTDYLSINLTMADTGGSGIDSVILVLDPPTGSGSYLVRFDSLVFFSASSFVCYYYMSSLFCLCVCLFDCPC
jgi:hypothetical protein